MLQTKYVTLYVTRKIHYAYGLISSSCDLVLYILVNRPCTERHYGTPKFCACTDDEHVPCHLRVVIIET